jgi:hypothetical protein
MVDFLGVPDPERPAPPLGPEVGQRQLFSLIRRLSRARSAREPAVYLFEDLHWFDRASEEFIENLVEIALRIVGISIIEAAVALFFGFLTFAFASLVPVQQFGLLTGMTMVTALAANLVLLPALLATTKIITVWDRRAGVRATRVPRAHRAGSAYRRRGSRPARAPRGLSPLQ